LTSTQIWQARRCGRRADSDFTRQWARGGSGRWHGFDPRAERQSGKIKQTKFIVRAIPNATLNVLFVQMNSDLGCEVTCDVRTIKEYQIEICGIFEPPPFRLSRIVRDEWTAWHKLWRNLEGTENQIQCLILLDVEARIQEEAEEIEVWSPIYPRSLQTEWIGNNE